MNTATTTSSNTTAWCLTCVEPLSFIATDDSIAVCHFGFMEKIYGTVTESVRRNGDLYLQRRK